MSGVREAAETVRGTLRTNGVMRYGRFERENTYGALEALKVLVEAAERTEQLEHERDTLREALDAISKGRWAIGVPRYTGSGVRMFARDVLAGGRSS